MFRTKREIRIFVLNRHTDVRNSYNDNYGRGRLEMVVWLANAFTLDYSGGGGGGDDP